MTKITKQELNQMIKEEVRKQTSRNRRRLFENNNEDFEIKGTILIKYNDNDANVTIPDGVTEIGDRAFCDCNRLTSVTIPNSVTSIGYRTFSCCESLISVIIPNSVTSIGTWAFENCTNLTSITIPNSVKSIGEWAFSNCESLKSITIPNSVTSIGSWAFENCDNLTDIKIPERFKDDDTLDDIGFNDNQIDIILNKTLKESFDYMRRKHLIR